MVKPSYLLVYLFFVSVSFWAESAIVRNGNIESKAMVPVGVILDLNSKDGEMAEICTSMAYSDFYAAHANYKTRLSLHKRDSKGDVIGAASAALDLMKNLEVQAIIGPQRSAEAKFVIDLGEKAHVPIISFSAKSPSLSPTQSPYFVRTTQDDSSQVQAIVAIVQAFGWGQVVPIYEDTEYGKGLIPYLIDAFQGIYTRVPYRSIIPPSASDFDILRELNKLMANQARVFVVHMTAALGSRLFSIAKEAGMMSEGYAWIITDGLSRTLDLMTPSTIDSMQGVLGIKPYIARTKDLEDLEMRWKRKLRFKEPNNKINLFGIQAYDTIWALAMAVERVGPMNCSFLKSKTSENSNDLATLGISKMGPRLLKTILKTSFKGLIGEFHLVKGQLQSSSPAFQIFNVIRKGEMVIGYWTPMKGLSRRLDAMEKITYSTSVANLKKPIWPGDSKTKPRGWLISTRGKKLKIGVPKKKGFTEFVKVERDPQTNETTYQGFSIEVFRGVLEKLPFDVPYDFQPFMDVNENSAGNYNDLVYKVYLQEFDAVVGDTTIVANRSKFVDFTLPYSESGVSMVVPIKYKRKNGWIFLKPLNWDLWLTIGVGFIFTGVVVWILEHRLNTEFRGPLGQHLGMMLWFGFSTLTFAQREKVVNNLTRFVLIIWMFVVLILTQSYTASLSSMLTVQSLAPPVIRGCCVGYQTDSFVKGLLTNQLNFNESMLKNYSTIEEYDDALTQGSQKGGVDAIFDEIPYIKNFLASKYGSKYTMAGPTYKTDGFGFVFPLNCPLVPYISKAILKFIEGEGMKNIERKYFKSESTYLDKETSFTSNRLSIDDFWGLFLITGIASCLSLSIYLFLFLYQNRHVPEMAHSENSLWKRLVALVKHFDKKDFSSRTFKRAESTVYPLTTVQNITGSANVDSYSPSRVLNQTSQNLAPPTTEEEMQEQEKEEIQSP